MKMRKIGLLALACLMLSGCGSGATDRQMAGTYQGVMLGGMIGSAIGGIVGGHRASALGNVIGMAAGGVLGHATSSPRGRRTPKGALVHPSEVAKVWSEAREQMHDAGRLDSLMPEAQVRGAVAIDSMTKAVVEIEDLAIYEAVTDGVLQPKERAEIEFILHNTTDETLTNVVPVVRATPDKYIIISPSVSIAEIKPQGKLRYTAFVYVRGGIKAKPVEFSVRVDHRGRVVDEKLFTLQGRKPL